MHTAPTHFQVVAAIQEDYRNAAEQQRATRLSMPDIEPAALRRLRSVFRTRRATSAVAMPDTRRLTPSRAP